MEASGGDDGSKGPEITDPRHRPQPGSDGLAKHAWEEHHARVTITARVHNHSVALPADLEVPEGAEVQVILPARPDGEATEGALAWMKAYAGVLDSLPPDAAERHNELAHGRKRRHL